MTDQPILTVSDAAATLTERAASPTKSARLAALLGFGFAALLAFSFAFTPLRTSTDEFWHLKTGQWIVQHGALPQNDIFTYTAAHLPWHNHEWLTQAAMWKLYALGESTDFGGWRAVILVKSILVVLAYAGFGLLLALRMRQPAWAALAAALAAGLARRTFYPRPPVVTYALLALVFWLLIEWRSGRLRARWLWLLVPVFALWSNLHGGWLAGLVLGGAFWADSALAAALGFRREGWRGPAMRRALQLTGFGAACALATLANPYGYHLYELTVHVMADDPYLLACIGEMRPANWNFVVVMEVIILALAAAAARPVSPLGFVLTGLLLVAIHYWLHHVGRPLSLDPSRNALLLHAWLYAVAALPVFAAACLRVRPPGWVAHFLIGAFFLQQGIYHVRHLSLTAIAILPILAWSLEGWAEAWSQRRESPRRAALANAAALSLIIPLCLGWIFASGDNFRVFDRIKPLAFLARQEGFSYAERNGMLLIHNMAMQPAFVDATKSEWPIKNGPPPGFYTIDPYPVQAANFMIRAKLPGPIWNDGNHSGYLIWALAPEHYKLFTDNRYDIYGGLVIREEHSVSNGWDARDIAWYLKADPDYFKGAPPPPWDKVLDKYGIQTVFIPAGDTGNIRLEQSKAWALVWVDYDFNIWVRDTPANKEAIERAKTLPRPVTARRIG